MAFEILSAEAEDALRWTALVNKLPAELRDIHFLPDYGRIYRDTYGFSPHLAVYRAGGDFVIQPFVRRPLRDLPFLADAPDAGNFSDIANPYGYGGPLSNVSDPETARLLYSGFAEAFAEWCDEADIASEFVSLHPFMAQYQLALVNPVIAPKLEKNIVFIDLAQSETALTKSLRKGHRSSIAAARRAGVRIEKREATASNLAVFNEMYDTTMVRQQAADRWFVPNSYFETCMRQLGAGRSSLFFAIVDGEVESGCLLMHDFAMAYYHFAGTYAKHPALGVNNLMVYETAIWARAAGYTRYHLGGGVTRSADDSLLRFKAGFSDLRTPLYTYFRVRDQVVYDQLCERKRAFELATTGTESASDFVPIYRR